MNNFDFLNKGELSYILNNEKIFGSVLIGQIEEYCQRKKYSIDKIRERIPEWEESAERLNFIIDENEIVISKTDEAKRADYSGVTFVIVVIALLLLFGLSLIHI